MWQERGYNNDSAMAAKMQSKLLLRTRWKPRCEPGDMTVISFTCISFSRHSDRDNIAGKSTLMWKVESQKMMSSEIMNGLAKIRLQLQLLREKGTGSKLITSRFQINVLRERPSKSKRESVWHWRDPLLCMICDLCFCWSGL